MHVLITFGSKRGGTEGIARMLAEELVRKGVDASVLRPDQVEFVDAFDAVIVGGALYFNRWHRDARRFVGRHAEDLRRMPVWFFSSGPVDDSADRRLIPPTGQVEVLMDRVGAQGHATFGGRLAPDAKGFLASRLAKENNGDFRDQDRIRAWATEIARALPTARPGVAIHHAAHSVSRLVAHGVAGWAVCAATMMLLLGIARTSTAIALHALLVPVVFAVVASRYFKGHGSRAPLPTALTFAGIVALLDLVIVAGFFERSLAMFRGFAGTWLPLLLIVASTWATGTVMSLFSARASPAR